MSDSNDEDIGYLLQEMQDAYEEARQHEQRAADCLKDHNKEGWDEEYEKVGELEDYAASIQERIENFHRAQFEQAAKDRQEEELQQKAADTITALSGEDKRQVAAAAAAGQVLAEETRAERAETRVVDLENLLAKFQAEIQRLEKGLAAEREYKRVERRMLAERRLQFPHRIEKELDDWFARTRNNLDREPILCKLTLEWSINGRTYIATSALDATIHIWVEVPRDTIGAMPISGKHCLPANNLAELARAFNAAGGHPQR